MSWGSLVATPLTFELSYAGVPFIVDSAKTVRLKQDFGEVSSDQNSVEKQQPLPDLIDEINRIWPLQYLQDFTLPPTHLGRSLGALAYPWPANHQPNPTNLRIGDWYYPTNASRWSVFRYLATSSQAKKMESEAMGKGPKTFKMTAVPSSPSNPAQQDFELSTQMYLLPPRTVGEGSQMDGLFLITLVDERYYFQGTPTTIKPDGTLTWATLITQVATDLGITVNTPTVPTAYNQPEPDSQFWCNMEYAAFLLDAIAFNLGMVVVRNLDGTYDMLSPSQSLTRVNTNRGDAKTVVRLAGGHLFNSGTKLPIGDLTPSRNAVCPRTVNVTFPKYVFGNDPVPHYLNTRYAAPRPTAWWEDSYGDVYVVEVPITSGGSLVSGVSGIGEHVIQDTAKALYATEASAASGQAPDNSSGLTALAMQAATDYWGQQAAVALDETYPGTVDWSPDGIHDIIWTYSARTRQASTRLLRTEWNQVIRQLQHSAPALSGSIVIPGVGGHSVAQTWREVSGSFHIPGVNLVSLNSGLTLTSGVMSSGGITEVIIGVVQVGSGAILSGSIGPYSLASGAVRSGHIGDYAVLSGSIASGQIYGYHLSSGSVFSGHLGQNSLNSGNAASGFLSTASHYTIAGQIITGETISGGRSAAISPSGFLWISMASVQERQPTAGIVIDNVNSGILANLYVAGSFQFANTLVDYSGYIGKAVYVGRSGQLVTTSGSWNSGGLIISGDLDIVEKMGVALNSGGFIMGD